MNLKTSITWIKQHRTRLLLWLGGIFLAIIMFTTLVLPGIIKTQAEKAILQETGRVATLQRVSFNPFGMTLTIKGFRLFEPDRKTPFVQLGTLEVSLSSSSLFRFAPVVDELLLGEPQLHLVRTAANRYNFSDILDKLASRPKPKDDRPVRFSLNNILVQNGSIDFDDQAIAGGKKHTIRDLQLAVPFISNIPYLAEQYTDPKFSAVINGARFSSSGKAKPLAKAVEAELHLKLIDLDLPHYLAYLPIQMPIKVPTGSLSLDLNLIYRIHKDKKPELLIKGLTQINDLSVTETNGAPLLDLEQLDLQAREIEVFNRLISLQHLSLDGLELQLERANNGILNFQRILPKTASVTPAKPQPKAVTPAAPPLQLQVDNLLVHDSSVTFIDHQPAGGFSAGMQQIEFKLTDFSTKQDAQARYTFACTGDQGETLRAAGTAAITPLSVISDFQLEGIKLQRGWPYLKALMSAPLQGTLALEGKVSWNKQTGAVIKDLGVHLKNLSATYGDKETTRLNKLDLNGIGFNQLENKAMVESIALSGGNVVLSKESDGKLSILSLLKTGPAPSQPAKPVGKPAVKTHPLHWQVNKITVNGLAASFKDKTFSEPPVFNLNRITLNAANLTGPTFASMPFSFSATYGKQAPLKMSGRLTPLPFRFVGTVSCNRLPLTDFEDYIPDNVHLYLLGGSLDTSMKVDLALDKDNKPNGSFSGNLGVRGFHTVDTVQEDDLLKWESLQLDQISGKLSPFSLAVHQIALNGVYARVAIRQDKTLNLQNLVSKPEPVPTPPTVTQAAPTGPQPPLQTAQAAQKAQIRIDALTIQDGTMDFSDAHLPQRFRTTFYNLGGRVSGLSSDMNTRAEVDLRGNLENHSPLQITGSVNPLRDDLFVDLTISFKDIDLVPATPYSGTYLGYQIDKGKLFLDLKYHIENKELKASNKVFVDQFTFGKTVESKQATNLPVRLGVALLKDRNGEIHLDLPVSGRTDDPKFSIWGVVWQVVTNLFVKAATSPFALLSSMFGSNEDLGSVAFAPGSTALSAAEQNKLHLLAKALQDRPGLKVEIAGYVDKNHDPEGYRAELLLQKMRREKYLELAKNQQIKEAETAETITLQPAEYSHYLKLVYQKEKFPKPRNFIGMVKDLPDAEMKKLIIANTTVGDQELQQLAAQRAAAVRQFLINQGKINSQRVFQKQDNIMKQPKQENSPASRVELNPIAS